MNINMTHIHIGIDLTGYYGVAYLEPPYSQKTDPSSIVILSLESGEIIREINTSYVGESIAVDKNTNTIYSINFNTGELWKYDICLETKTFIKDTNICPYGMDFNENDGYIYASDHNSGGKAIYKIDPSNGDISFIGETASGFITALLVSKDGTQIITANWIAQALYYNILPNPETSTTTAINIPFPISQQYGADSLDWLNDDINDDRLVMCWGLSLPLECFIYDPDTQQYTPILTNVNMYIRGLDVLNNIECTDNSALIVDNNPPQSGGEGSTGVTNDDDNICKCFSNLDNNIKYCASSCCDIGILVETKINGDIYQYGAGIINDEYKCFTKVNGEYIREHVLLARQYYECNTELTIIADNVTCSISDAFDTSIYDAIKAYYNRIIRDNDLSISLIVLYIVFLLMFIMGIICLITMIVNGISTIILKNDHKYCELNNDTNTDSTSTGMGV